MLKAAVLALACVVPATGFASGGSFVARRFAVRILVQTRTRFQGWACQCPSWIKELGSHRQGWAPFLAHIVQDGLPSWLPSSRMSSHPGSNSAFLCIFSSPSWPCTLLQGGAAALSMSTSKQILDPMDIMHSKSMQDCPLRAYK